MQACTAHTETRMRSRAHGGGSAEITACTRSTPPVTTVKVDTQPARSQCRRRARTRPHPSSALRTSASEKTCATGDAGATAVGGTSTTGRSVTALRLFTGDVGSSGGPPRRRPMAPAPLCYGCGLVGIRRVGIAGRIRKRGRERRRKRRRGCRKRMLYDLNLEINPITHRLRRSWGARRRRGAPRRRRTRPSPPRRTPRRHRRCASAARRR